MREMLKPGSDLTKVSADLAGFRCARDSDIEEFLRQDAIPFEKAHKSRTYLIVKKQPLDHGIAILGYFSLAISRMRISKGVSRTKIRKLNGIGERRDVPCYLIGQLGKNDDYSGEIDGTRLITYAMSFLMNGHEQLGGRFVRVDCRDIAALCEFYERNGFVRYQQDRESGLMQLVRYF